MSDELASLDATAQAELVRQRKASPRELVDAAIARIERVNPKLNAVIIQRFEKARAEAAAPDLPAGPFRGVPFLLKDLICHSAGDPYHAGMRFLRELEWVERYDTHLAARFRAAGFVFLGRTNVPVLSPAPTTEPLAYGPTRNPWDTSRSPGGSSGGSAAAVAAGLVPVAHANDGGGSIRIPSSECGLVGLKPSRGRTSLGPDVGEGWGGLSVEHVVARSVRDTAAVLDAVARATVPRRGGRGTGKAPRRAPREGARRAGGGPSRVRDGGARDGAAPRVARASRGGVVPRGARGRRGRAGRGHGHHGRHRARPGLLERAHGAEDRSRRHRAHDLGDRRDGAPGERERLSPGDRVPARAHAAGGDLVGGWLRPPAHPDAPRATAPPGRVRPGARRSPARLHTRRHLRRLHHALQRHRAAGRLAPAPLEHRRPPDRRPARRRLRTRGPAPPHRGPARGGAPVERAAPARARVSRPCHR